MGLRLLSTPLDRAAKLAVVSVAEAKAQARITTSAEDDLIGSFIETAYDFLSGPDGWLNGYCLLREEWQYEAEPERESDHLRFRCGRYRPMEFPLRPCDAITVEYAPDSATYAPLETANYTPTFGDGGVAGIRLSYVPALYGTGYYPGQRRIRMTAQAGHESADTIPAPLKQCIKMIVGELYLNREMSAVTQSARVMFGLQALAGRYRFEPDHS